MTYLDAFLRERGLAREMLSPPDPLPPPSHFGDAAKAEFARYLASTAPHKAFAVASNGGYGWRSGRSTVDDAQRDSLAACMKWSPTCTLYAIDDQLAGQRPTDIDGPELARAMAPVAFGTSGPRRLQAANRLLTRKIYEVPYAVGSGTLQTQCDVETRSYRRACVGLDVRACRRWRFG